jgi:hypothetical protein
MYSGRCHQFVKVLAVVQFEHENNETKNIFLLTYHTVNDPV